MIQKYLLSKKLSAFPNLIHGFTTRHLGDNIAHTVETMKLPHDHFISLKQIHSNKVYCIEHDPAMTSRTLERDALITQEKNIFLSIRTADCIPILVYDTDKNVAAAIHAGWRGLVNGVIEATFHQMKKKFSSNPNHFWVAVGATLCPGCFEVGPEVAKEFKNKWGAKITITQGNEDRSYLDLRQACDLILKEGGIPQNQIDWISYCTACCKNLFFSYRRGDRNQRMMAFIGIP